jgi:serine/threonine protein phosphatase PrpC
MTTSNNRKMCWFDCGVNLLDKKQDYVQQGSNEQFDWMVVLDGHGKGNVARVLSNLSWNDILMTYEDPTTLLAHINGHLIYDINGRPQNNFKDGSTCCIIKNYRIEHKFITHWIGDSQIGINLNSKYYYSTPHDATNSAEMQRIRAANITTTKTWTPVVLNNNLNISMRRGTYILHDYKYDTDMMRDCNTKIEKPDSLSMTRALGHNHGDVFATKQEFDTMELHYKPEDTLVVIAATDGLWDILPSNTNFIFANIITAIRKNDNPVTMLLEFAESRWKAIWNYYLPSPWGKPNDPPKNHKMTIYDDIGIAIYCVI